MISKPYPGRPEMIKPYHDALWRRRELDMRMAKKLRDHQATTPNLTRTEELLLAGVARLLESIHEIEP